MMTHRHVHLDVAWKTPQFWLLWRTLCLNVSAGIGVLGMASPMLQEVFGGKLLGLHIGFNDVNADQKKQIAAIAAGFSGLLSLCNIGGRIGWASMSDRLGRKTTFSAFFVLGFFLYAAAPWAAHAGSVFVFVLCFCVIPTMYGGGFATIPAYLADMFGTHMVGAIHGRLLTAWSTAGVLGPVLVNYVREYQLAAGVPHEAAYNQTMNILAGLLVLGLVCNLLVRPVAERFYMTDEEAGEWLWEQDPEGHYMYSSGAVRDILGFMPMEIRGKHYLDLLIAEDRMHWTAALPFPSIDTQKPFLHLINRYRHKDGHEVYTESTGTPLFDDQGKGEWITIDEAGKPEGAPERSPNSGEGAPSGRGRKLAEALFRSTQDIHSGASVARRTDGSGGAGNQFLRSKFL